MKSLAFGLIVLCLTACDAPQKTIDVHWDIDEPTFEAIFGGETRDCGEIEWEEKGEVMFYKEELNALYVINLRDIYVVPKYYDSHESGTPATILKNDCGVFFRDLDGFKYLALDNTSLIAK